MRGTPDEGRRADCRLLRPAAVRLVVVREDVFPQSLRRHHRSLSFRTGEDGHIDASLDEVGQDLL